MKKIVLGTVCAAALVLATGSASASGTNAELSGSYANLSNGGGDVYSVDGALNTSFGGGWGGEVTGGYHHATAGGGADLGNVGGSVFYAMSDFRVAATVNYMDLSIIHLTSYGAGGEWYASPSWTVAVRGGGVTGQAGVDGGYAGGDVKWYVTPNFSVNAGVDYINLNGLSDLTTEDVRAEYLISQTTPVSLFGGYAHADSGGAGSQDIFFVGIKLYTNGSAAGGTLVDRQRNGNIGYIGGVPYFGQIL